VAGLAGIDGDHEPQLGIARWLKRPRREKAFDNLMRLTSSLQ
jgi:hypothetical protein